MNSMVLIVGSYSIFMIDRLKNILSDSKNRAIAINVMGSFVVKGFSLILSLLTMPVYMRFFPDKSILGIWYTLYSIVTWASFFDLGLGNGLRNKLPKCFEDNDKAKARSYISSTYISILGIVFVWAFVGYFLIDNLNWNVILKIDSENLDLALIRKIISIILVGILFQFVTKIITSILYAIQMSAIVNLLSLITTGMTLVLVYITPSRDLEHNFICMAWISVIAMNVPNIIATIIVFGTKLKIYIPRIRDYSLVLAKEVVNIGFTLLWLTVVFMVVSLTNEFLITALSNPEYVVEYQGYNKIFNTVSALFTLALAPIWSAVTKAFVNKEYLWIKKLNSILLSVGILLLTLNLLIIPFLQIIVNVWLGKNYIIINPLVAVIFAVSNAIIYIHNVNTSIGNGISFFKVQFIWVTFAALIDIPLAYILVRVTGSWVGVILANIIALLPYEIIEIFAINRHLSNAQ